MRARILVPIVAVQCLLTVLVLARSGSGQPEPAPSPAPVLRGSALELVDDAGRVRAQIDVERDGEVVLRLRDVQGAIRVKLGASQAGSGLVLLNQNTEPGVQLLAEASEAKLTLAEPGGRSRVIEP
jgi:hypothetical protein